MTLTIINDCHLLAHRSTGTTPHTAQALIQWNLEQFERLLSYADGGDLLINGDLFDRAQPTTCAVKHTDFSHNISGQTYITYVLKQWCERNLQHKLLLSAGNHDLPRNDQLPSAFGTLCDTLKLICPNVIRIDGYNYHQSTYAVVPHYANQSLFETALNAALDLSSTYIFVHANYDNPFAQQTDHSLNISQEMAQRFAKRNKTLVFGHEHHARQQDNIHIIGNQIISSIADCLGNNLHKYYVQLKNGQLNYLMFQDISQVYQDIPWTEDKLPNVPFIRVSGQASSSQAVQVIHKLALWRKHSNAFIINNAVSIERSTLSTLTPFTEHSTFDVWQELMQRIPQDLQSFAQEVFQYVKSH